MLERFCDVSVLLHYLILQTIDKELWLKQISHNDIRITNLLPAHFPECKIQPIPISVNLVLKVAIDYIGYTRAGISHLIHEFHALTLELTVSPLGLLVLAQEP